MFWAITKKKADGLASILILRDYLASLIHHHSESKTLTELVQISGIHSLKLVLSRFKILYSGYLDLRSVLIMLFGLRSQMAVELVCFLVQTNGTEEVKYAAAAV